jgi:DMSO/TMAO reductase YedYZ molybdopterin-dependent catalytic subunit
VTPHRHGDGQADHRPTQPAPDWLAAALRRVRAGDVAPRYRSPLHDDHSAAWLGLALGLAFAVCFATGVWSHLQQDPPPWFDPPARPAGLYRVTQGLHVVTGFATIPLLLAKLWVVHPKLAAWPPARSVAHAIERLALVPLVGGAAFLLMSGVANVARWYPWTFFFPRAHFWAAWITIGGLVVHVGAKAEATLRIVRSGPLAIVASEATATAVVVTAAPGSGAKPARHAMPGEERARAAAASADRRTFLFGVGAAAATLAVATAGGTVAPLSPISFLAQRRPGDGPQGLPVNKSAASAGVEDAARDPGYRLVVDGAVERPLSLTVADLRGLDLRTATLPIACVEGWSRSATWRGVPLRVLVAMAGADPARARVTVESLQEGGRYRAAEVAGDQLEDLDTLLALDLGGEPLALDHGFPVRLIGPNRPGVLQTKWVSRLVLR